MARRYKANTPKSIPAGVILMWSGRIAAIPSGWALCDGNNGTPDLRNKFVIAAAQDSGVAGEPVQAVIENVYKNSGGVDNHAHVLNGASAELTQGYDVPSSGGMGSYGAQSNVSGWTDNVWNYPPCVALAYIMKL